jgi:hypothetical protein
MTGHAQPQGFRISAAPPGIVRLCWTPGLRITGALAAAAMTAVDELNGDQTRPLLVEMTGADTPTREAREHFGRRCTASRIALLGESAVDRVRASPGVGSRGVPVPTRFFTSEPAALEWLLRG